MVWCPLFEELSTGPRFSWLVANHVRLVVSAITFSVVSEGMSQVWPRLFVVSGLSVAAFSAPLLDIFGRNPEVFVANRTSPFEILAFGLIVVLMIPALAFVVLSLSKLLGQKAFDIAYGVMVAMLGLTAGLVISRQVFPDATIAAVTLAMGVAVLVVAVHRRVESVLVWFSLALPAVLLLFLFASPSGRLVWAQPEEETATVAVESPAPIVLLQLDEMPAASIMDRNGEVNSALFPSFARLAEEGTWYRNALSNSIATTQSVPAVLTGRLGEKGMSPSSVDYPDNLFTLLDGGYEMHVIEWVADLCPDDVCPEYAGRAPARFTALIADVGVVYGHLTLPSAVRAELPSIDNAWKGFLGQNDKAGGVEVEVPGVSVPRDGTRADWVNWLQRIINGVDDGSKPVLSYAHLQAPHVPWQTNPSGTHYTRPEEYTEVEGVEGNGRWGADESASIMGFQRHLYQVGFVDTMLGQLFTRLDSTGVWDDTMIIVVADHGASFVTGEHRRWPYEDNRADLYRVPLFIKYPAQSEGLTVDEPAFGIDILPTIVDVLGVSTEWAFDGMSLLDVDGVQRPHEAIWWCCEGEGASTDLAELIDQVERNYSWVPDQNSWLGVAGVGPYGGLVGQPVAALDVEKNEELRWSLEHGASLGDVDPDSGKVQTLLTGRIEVPEGTIPDDVLVVLNGTVAGVGYVSRDTASGGAIRGLVAEELVLDGPNDIDILIPNGSSWISGSADVLRLELHAEDGRRIELNKEGSRRIQVDAVTAADFGWIVSGWSADVTKKVVPDTIYVFAGNQLLASGPPTEDNANVVRWFGSDDLLRSGFSFDIDATEVPEGVDQLTVVAEFGDYAIGDPARLTR